MILPEVYQGGGWFPSFSRFMEAFDPKWYRTYGCAPYTPEEVRETAVEFAPDIPALPEEYLDFLAHMGGRGLDLHHRAWLYHGGQLYLSGEEETCLTIGSYNLLDEGDRLAYCFPKEGPPYLVWRERWSDMTGGQVKVADSLGQLLCNQAFLAEGTEQFSFWHPLDLAFHLHQPPYRPCPEAEEYCRTHPVEGLTEKELEDIGFQLQVKKLVGPLEQLGYERAWFSTELDHIWLREDACCIISREFDPNDMFDTAAVSLWGMGKETVWALAEQFKRLGYGNALEMRDGST